MTQPTPIVDQLLTVRQVADIVQLTPQAIYLAIKDGKLVAERGAGKRSTRVKRSEMDRWLKGTAP